MHPIRNWITLLCCLAAATPFSAAQTRKPGLWEMTSTMTWQQSPFPAGMANPMAAGGPRTTQVCLTQEQIDKYGAITQPSHGCQITNIVRKTNSMTADIVCTGHMSGKGSMESSWSDDEHATGKVHFVGSMSMGQDSKPIEWTAESSSVYKGADCGSVKPIPTQDK